jgi:hypothetical protein
MVSLPLRKALLEPEEASTTALPVLAQLLRADWMRDVSSLVGGVSTSTDDALNCALSVWQAEGVEG